MDHALITPPVAPKSRQRLAAIASGLAGVSVALAAYAAHGAPEAARPMLLPAVGLLFGHGVAVSALAPLAIRKHGWWGLLLMMLGAVVFAASVFGKALHGWPSTFAPVGGVAMMAGWALHAWSQWRR